MEQLCKVVAVAAKMKPTPEILDAVWPWPFSTTNSSMLYGKTKIDLLLFTGEERDFHTWSDVDRVDPALPNIETVIFYRAINLKFRDCILRVIEFEDETLWEVMTDFVPRSVGTPVGSESAWETRQRMREARKYLHKACRKGYFLTALEGEHLELHRNRLAEWGGAIFS